MNEGFAFFFLEESITRERRREVVLERVNGFAIWPAQFNLAFLIREREKSVFTCEAAGGFFGDDKVRTYGMIGEFFGATRQAIAHEIHFFVRMIFDENPLRAGGCISSLGIGEELGDAEFRRIKFLDFNGESFVDFFAPVFGGEGNGIGA